ncbi:RET3 [Candida pseudojiufengensis]|uniref:RET3 n=1 Tax=Candida pseudojiufengensis TaxID=497109 RepID=UPI00222451E2|nr:RET3 [Candida pseudojiufengensis]KAI5963623.1 RET3 [Candida pseudojiufengensis]
MSLNISLYTVSALLILDNEGNRLYAKYYTSTLEEQQPQKETSKSTTTSKSTSSKSQTQLKFEKKLFSKINKINQDIILYDNQLIVYKQINDVTFILTSPINENECMAYTTLSNLIEAITILLNNSIDQQIIIQNYDLVSLAIDETIDDGIIIEYDPATIVSRVTNAPIASTVDLKNIDISEKGLFNALSFAGKKLSERLNQGL